MRNAALLLCLLVPSAAAQGAGGDQRPCEFEGHTLKGRVRIVDSFPDFQVKIEPDARKAELFVRRVEQPAELCGEWQFVDGMADFTIRFVDAGEDFKIAWVKNNPGIPDDPVQR